MRERPALVLLLGVLLAPCALAGVPAQVPAPPPPAASDPAPAPSTPSDATVVRALERGVEHLLATQNADGSWGSTAPTLTVDIYAPGVGAFEAYQAASSALALSGLIEARAFLEEARWPALDAGVRRAADWLVRHHAAKRATPDVLYNVWAHAYALEAFARLLAREADPARRASLLAASREAVALLERYEYVDGGWGYYDFSVGSRTPSHGHANSFTTATALMGLGMAAEQGVEVPPRLVRRAVTLVRSSRLPGGSYAYSFGRHEGPPRGVNDRRGSVARTPACLAALRAWEDPVPSSRLVAALDDLETFGHFLRIARKYPIPHETWYQNSGYFCFYGYYYASDLLDQVPAAARDFHRLRIAAHLVPLQESDGSWWDYQLYRYHKPYGTGYVLVTLARCLAARAATDG